MKEITRAEEVIEKAKGYFGGINEAIAELEKEYEELRSQEGTGGDHSAAGFHRKTKIRGEIETNGKALHSALEERQMLLEEHRAELINESSAVWSEYVREVREQAAELAQAIRDKDKEMQELVSQINQINLQALSDYRAEVINPLNEIASSWRAKTGNNYIPSGTSYTLVTAEGIIRAGYGS